MHRLDRNTVAAPLCITPHDPAREFDTLPVGAKAEIRERLLALQQNRCAYCERRTGTDPNAGHIEHFRSQALHHNLRTDWNNLFWSCTDPKCCGKYKDTCRVQGGAGRRRGFDPADIINPSIDDPDHFLQFISDGSIQPRKNLTAAEQQRYEETLRVFQLAEAAFLIASRRDAVKPYIDALADLANDGPDRVRAYIARQLERIGATPFETAVRHFLMSYAP